MASRQGSGSKVWDRIGATASTICAVHCVLTGVALGLLSTIGFGFFASPLVDYGFVGIAVVVGGLALYHGVRRHGHWGPSLMYVLGLTLLIGSHFGFGRQHVHEHGHSLFGSLLSATGGLSFVAFHVWNLRLQHRHDSSCRCKHVVCRHEP